MADVNVHKGHRQRMREHVLSEGLDSFAPHQVIEYLLFYAIPRQDTSAIAHALIDRFKTVRGVLTASREELKQVGGVGDRTADWLMRVGELTEAYADMRLDDRPRVLNFKSALEFCIEKRRTLIPPLSYQICMTPQGVVLLFGKIADSTAWAEPAALKKGLNDAFSMHARSIIVAQFRQEGECKPTEYDCEMARRYAFALATMDVLLQDIILVTPTEILSMNQNGDYVIDEELQRRFAFSARYLREQDDEQTEEADKEEPETDMGL